MRIGRVLFGLGLLDGMIMTTAKTDVGFYFALFLGIIMVCLSGFGDW